MLPWRYFITSFLPQALKCDNSFSSWLPTTGNNQPRTHNLPVSIQSSWRTASLSRCFMLTLAVISSAVSTGHWKKPGIYCSSHHFLATSLLSPPPTCCREIKFQQTSACSQWISTFKGTYKHTKMLSNWAIFLHSVLIEKKISLILNQWLLVSAAFCQPKERDPPQKQFIGVSSLFRGEKSKSCVRILWALYQRSQSTLQLPLMQEKNA